MTVILVGEDIGTAAMSQVLAGAGHSARVIPFERARQIPGLVEEITRDRPELLVLHIQARRRAHEYFLLSRKLRAGGYRGHITCGGPFPTVAFWELVDENHGLSSVVVDESGQPLVDLVDALSRGKGLERVAGLTLCGGGPASHRIPHLLKFDLCGDERPLRLKSPQNIAGDGAILWHQNGRGRIAVAEPRERPTAEAKGATRPIVFLGPSLSGDRAREILEADYRPPIKRGQLDELPGGVVVGLIDGVFQQDLAISPREVLSATQRGVRIMGGSSMGALRAAEVPSVVGVGRIYEMYRSGVIDRDDEVALLFDLESGKAHTVPLVNTRYATEQLARSGSIDWSVANRIVAAAEHLHFTERTYRTILKEAGLDSRADVEELGALLSSFDLKREDAQLLLECLPSLVAAGGDDLRTQEDDTGADDGEHEVEATVLEERIGKAPMMLWELGERVTFEDLSVFMKMTGSYKKRVRNVLARYLLGGGTLELKAIHEAAHTDSSQRLFESACWQWGWLTVEEIQTTMVDLGLGLEHTAAVLEAEARARAAVDAVAAHAPGDFQAALRAELFLDDLALKRELIRAGSLKILAQTEREHQVTRDEVEQARLKLCVAHQRPDWTGLAHELMSYGVDVACQDRLVTDLARARGAARRCRERMTAMREKPPLKSSRPLQSSKKAPGQERFCKPMSEAMEVITELKEVVGITRVGLISELTDLDVHIAQASRPGGYWSSTYGSGKSESREGAIVGSVMEETEKWAQEQFTPGAEQIVRGTYQDLSGKHNTLDPRSLPLPFDSVYDEAMTLDWYWCDDLLRPEPVLVPVDLFTIERNHNDICFSRRGGRKIATTNGLASGFTVEEALLHAVCEYIERHARKLASMRLDNPGGVRRPTYRFVELDSCAPAVRRLITKLEPPGHRVRVLDITCEVDVATYAALIEAPSGQQAVGFATHPNPEVAVKMALLEAAQSVGITVAGGREDLTLKARSLGRHGGARPNRRASWAFVHDPDAPTTTLSQRSGIVSANACDELRWVLRQVHRTGIDNVAALDLSVNEMQPARAVRVIIPQLESNHEFRTGERARLAMLEDLLPEWHA